MLNHRMKDDVKYIEDQSGFIKITPKQQNESGDIIKEYKTEVCKLNLT